MAVRIRERWTTSVDPDLLKKLRELSAKTKIPVSRLADEAIELVLIQRKAIKDPAKVKPKPATPARRKPE